jgi:S-adenosylmethionine decarboxylase
MEFHQCVSEILNDPKVIEETLHFSLRTGNLTLVQMVTHAFAPHGLTVVAVLQESHAVVHTWPEIAFVAVDIFTCGDEGDLQGVCTALIRAWKPRQYNVRCFEREAMVPVGYEPGEERHP